MKSVLFKTLKIIVGIASAIAFITFCLITTIDRTPLTEQDFYKQGLHIVDTVALKTRSTTTSLSAGWAQVSITPAATMPMAGYRPRPAFAHVHDTLFARALVLNNGSGTVAFLSVDLLLFPPELRNEVSQLTKGQFDFVYYGATHTHNGIGGWDSTIGGQLSAGSFDEEWTTGMANRIVQALQKAKMSALPAELSYGESNADDLTGNRLVWAGPVEGTIRTLTLKRNDGTKASLFTFSAHANTLSKKSLDLSADYPGETINQLTRKGYDFAMYLAGMVASHRMQYPVDSLKEYDLIDAYSNELSNRILQTQQTTVTNTDFRFAHVPIAFGDAQFRLDDNLRIRPWLFNAVLKPLTGELTLLQVGTISFVGTPCDFSGELFLKNFKHRKEPLLITSFNGDYVGYITNDSVYYTSKKAEVMNMNWVGPYYGQYFSELIQKLIEKR